MTWGYFLLTLLMLVGFFLMFVILLQRGRGGGLAGAFGGLGGQSAFGTKAGDVFTVITIVTVVIWVILACVTAWRLRWEQTGRFMEGGGEEAEAIQAAPESDTSKTKAGEASKKDTDEGTGETEKIDKKSEKQFEGSKGNSDDESPTQPPNDGKAEKPDGKSSAKDDPPGKN